MKHAAHLVWVGACSPALADVLPPLGGVPCVKPSAPTTLTRRRQVLAGQPCAAGMCWCRGCRRMLWQHDSDDPKLGGNERLGCSLPALLDVKASCWSRDPSGGGVNACCAFRSWGGGFPAQQPAPNFYQTFQRVFLFAWKSNKHLNCAELGFPRSLFPTPFPMVDAAHPA